MKTAIPCPCHDPLVFGHIQPCPDWETGNVQLHRRRTPGERHLMNEFQVTDLSFSTRELNRAMQRFTRTVDAYNDLIRELRDATVQCSNLNELPPGTP